jgi:hypothetical protein
VPVKPFTFLAAVIFTLAALVHLARLALGWPVVINGIEIMMAIAVGMAIMVYRENSSA